PTRFRSPHLADMAVPEATPVDLVPQNRFLQQLRHVTEADCQALSRVDPCGELRSGTSHLAEADIRTGGDVGTCAFQGIDQERIGSRQNLVIPIDKCDDGSTCHVEPPYPGKRRSLVGY